MKKCALVIGMGISGKSASAYLLEQGFQVMGVDNKISSLMATEEIQELMKRGLECFCESDDLGWELVDLVVLSPGIAPSHPLYQKAVSLKKEIVGEVELAAKHLAKNRWIGITGTNGKTTVTALVAHLLNQAGLKARALGNIGEPLCSSIKEISEEEIIVAELSSYQLETMRAQVLDAAVILNITPDHLDRYPSMDEYARAKWNIQHCLKKGGALYVNEGCADPSKNKTFGYSSDSFIFSDLKSIYLKNEKKMELPAIIKDKKSHDIENFMAAYALCKEFGLEEKEIILHFSTFKKPHHRVEFVRSLNEVHFYDDSKGTNLDAVIRAVESIDSTIILIAGGVHKGSSYKAWIEPFKGKVKAIYAIGEAASIIYPELSSKIPVECCVTLEEAVKKAYHLSRRGDTVLLSPGCSSFDMFRDYAHRGELFKKYVWELI